MSYYIDLQQASDTPVPVSDETLVHWITLALSDQIKSAELTLRLVSEEEMLQLNSYYRQQHKTTNVLAFPSELPDTIELECPLLGDVVICPAVLEKESLDLQKPLIDHWAHIVIHGVLHLLGYDHVKEDDAKIMQAHEVNLLAKLNITNPYQPEDIHVE